MYTVMKTKMKVLVKDPDSAAILEKYCPGCLKHPQLKMAFNFPLEVISQYAPEMFKPEELPALDAELQALGDR